MSLDPITDPAVRPAFHLAIPVDDLDRAGGFYGGVLGLPRGRSSAEWIDWNLAGHQVVTHLVAGARSVFTPGDHGSTIALFDAGQDSRLNDGACDPAGRFLVGSMALDDPWMASLRSQQRPWAPGTKR